MTAKTENTIAAMKCSAKNFRIQFHPEVTHTKNGPSSFWSLCLFSCSVVLCVVQVSLRLLRRTPSSRRAAGHSLRSNQWCAIAAAAHWSRAIEDCLVVVSLRQHRSRERMNSKVLSMLQNNLHLNVRGVDCLRSVSEHAAGVMRT